MDPLGHLHQTMPWARCMQCHGGSVYIAHAPYMPHAAMQPQWYRIIAISGEPGTCGRHTTGTAPAKRRKLPGRGPAWASPRGAGTGQQRPQLVNWVSWGAG